MIFEALLAAITLVGHVAIQVRWALDDPANLRSGNGPTLGGEGHRAANQGPGDQAQLRARPPQQLAATAPCATGALAAHTLRSGSNRVGIQPCIGDGFNLKDSRMPKSVA
jgi:hypothetical protein